MLHFVQRLYIASFGIVYCCILHGCPQTCPPNPVKGLLEVNKDMVEVFLVLKIFITEDSYVEDLLCSAPSCSEACLFFCNDLLSLRLQSVQHDLQHDLDWIADKVDRSVVLALLQVAFLGKCVNQGLGPQGGPFSCLPDLVTDCRESGVNVLSTCLDQFCLDKVKSS